jgi:hypothetical protein
MGIYNSQNHFRRHSIDESPTYRTNFSIHPMMFHKLNNDRSHLPEDA